MQEELISKSTTLGKQELRSEESKLADKLQERIIKKHPQIIMELDTFIKLPIFSHRSFNEPGVNISGHVYATMPMQQRENFNILQDIDEDSTDWVFNDELLSVLEEMKLILTQVSDDAVILNKWIISIDDIVKAKDTNTLKEMEKEIKIILEEKHKIVNSIDIYVESRDQLFSAVSEILKAPDLRQNVMAIDEAINQTIWACIINLRHHVISLQAFVTAFLEIYKRRRINKIWGVKEHLIE